MAIRVLTAAAMVVLLSVPAVAQTTGTVAGSIRDAQGGVIPGATVTLTSESRGTSVPSVVTNTAGDYVFVNLAPDTYRLLVSMTGFRNLVRGGIAVSPGDRVAVPPLTIEVGGATETVEVTAEAPQIQAYSGERSYTVATESVEALPIFSRSFTQLATLAPGVTVDGNNTPTRIGGGGSTNILMDGVSSNDTGSNRPLLQMNTESIAEVKVLTSGYQAEYGRSSGVQVNAVTKSGTNRFSGSLYDVERNSDWNSNTKVNIVNGDPKAIVKERDWGFSLGGPAGRPGGNNKLFFFYSQEFSPRTGGNNVVRYRVPTALERVGDFSQTLDNNGSPYPYMKDPRSSDPCTAANTAGCFADGGVVGRIPADQLYQPGLAILNLWPLPTGTVAGQAYNFELTRPAEKILSWQPAVRLDYQATSALRASFRYSFWKQRSQQFNGSIPGFNDTRMQDAPVSNFSTSVNYTLNSTTFLEATYGRAQNELAGCAQAQSSTGPIFCTSAVPMGPKSSLEGAGLEDLPFLFPNATVLNPGYYAVQALNQIQPPFWDGSRMSKVPTIGGWGSRVTNTPPGIGFPGWFNVNRTHDFAISLTKVYNRHTFKFGFYNTNSFKAEQTSNNAFGNINFSHDAVGVNPFDTSFGFANAATGAFQSFLQATAYAETASVYNNTEWYAQDNWKLSNRLTLDYGLRFTHQQAQYDKFGQASNFLPDRWQQSQAPALYVPGCANGAATCTGINRQAMNPLTGQFLGPNSTLAIGTVVAGTGDPLNGVFLPGQDGVPRATFTSPWLGIAPRLGAAYDLTGDQRLIVRGGIGLFFDRPSSTTFSGGVNNPPTSSAVTVRYSRLQDLGSGGGLTTQGAPNLSAFQYDSKLPSSTQWNTGVQMALPWATALDVSYVGQHSFNTFVGTNINTIDFGTAFLDSNLDNTQAARPALSNELLRPIRGYNNINLQLNRGWQTYHSIQMSLNRRFRNGVSFGFNDTITLHNRSHIGARLAHAPDGSYTFRDDYAEAERLLGGVNTATHTMRGTFVWDLPDLRSDGVALRVVGAIVNDWQLSGVWSGSTGVPYSLGFGYQSGGGNIQLTGSPDYGARIRVVGDPGAGCSGDAIRQFNQSSFQGPLVGSVGLESSNNYLKGCFQSVLDLSIARNIRLGGGRAVQLRVDMFNAPNSAIVTNRNGTANFSNPNDPVTITNLPFDAAGNPIDARIRPRGAGFGVVNGYQAPRSVQLTARFSF
ncbi:MAG: hypothetical protein ABS36_15335 [Acidobacteria bacterium SCN 69-37]|nr:MAG: hypothetical protein ABS36_15335 [Acidobacteria bacterium SCN 69-37]